MTRMAVNFYYQLRSMASTSISTTQVCRLCNEIVKANRTIHLFSKKGCEHEWASRISTVNIDVDENDRISPYVCDKCTRRLESQLLIFKTSEILHSPPLLH